MNPRPWCLALLLASGSPLSAQQDPAALLALSHALNSKLGFTTRDLSRWKVVNDDGALGGTALENNGLGSDLSTLIEGPATVQFSLKGDFRYFVSPLSPVGLGARYSTVYDERPPAPWREYRLAVPAGSHRIDWHATGERDGRIDRCLVNIPMDMSELRQAVDFPGDFSFPGFGQWTVDRTTSLTGGASLLGYGPMKIPVKGPAVLQYALNIGGDGSGSGIRVKEGFNTLFDGWGILNYQWLPVAVYVPEGDHLLTLSNPSQTGWVWMDELAVKPAGDGLAEALGYPGPWRLGGNTPWHAQSAMKHSGDYAASFCLPNPNSGFNGSLETTIHGPAELSFVSHYIAENGSKDLELYLDNKSWARTMSSTSSFGISNPDWKETRLLVPEGEHTVRWLGWTSSYHPAFYLLDTVSVKPLPLIDIALALDGGLPWEPKGLHLPKIKSAASAMGGTLLESPQNRTGSCLISLPVQGPARFRFRFSGVAPAGSVMPAPYGRYAIYRDGVRTSPSAADSWRNPSGTGSSYEIRLPAGDLELVFDLKDSGVSAPLPVQLDAAVILAATGSSFAQWSRGFSLTPDDRNLDNDGDKRTNFFEYAFDTWPNLRDSRDDVLTIEPATDQSPATLVLKWNAGRIDAVWAIQESADLKTWTDRWVPEVAEASPGEGDYLTWRKAVPVEGAKRWFRAIVRPVAP